MARYVIPKGYESWFTEPVVRAPEPVQPPEPYPIAAWTTGIEEMLKALAPIAVGLLAIWLLASIGKD